MAVPSVAAQRTSTTPNPEPLWNAYPLDDGGSSAAAGGAKSGSTATPARAATTTAQTATTHLSDEAGDGPPWLLMAAAAGGGALFVVVLLTLQGRRARKREPDLVRAADKWPWLKPSDARAHDRRVERVGEATNGAPPPEPAFDVVEAIAVPRRRFEREPEVSRGEAAAGAPNGKVAVEAREGESAARAPNGNVAVAARGGEAAAVAANGKPTPARRGPICQVRWSPASACFYAVMTDADGFDERVARSPSFEWSGHEPPDEESREARAALRVLAKELRDTGWRPMRVKGTDFDEQRWYARRFRGSVAEGEEVSAPTSGSARA
jgi:hypothetical protein